MSPLLKADEPTRRAFQITHTGNFFVTLFA